MRELSYENGKWMPWAKRKQNCKYFIPFRIYNV